MPHTGFQVGLWGQNPARFGYGWGPSYPERLPPFVGQVCLFVVVPLVMGSCFSLM